MLMMLKIQKIYVTNGEKVLMLLQIQKICMMNGEKVLMLLKFQKTCMMNEECDLLEGIVQLFLCLSLLIC